MSNQVKPSEEVQLDPKIQNGPIEDRQCRDILCCILFLVSIIATVGCAIYGFLNGNPNLLSRPFDPNGLACGVKNDVNGTIFDYTENKYIYFVVPYTGYQDRTTCVSECPNDSTGSLPSELKCKTNSKVPSCASSFGEVTISNSANMQNNILSNMVLMYNTTPFLGRVCMPFDTNLLAQMNITSAIDLGQYTEYMSDAWTSWKSLLVCGGIALILGFVYMILMRCCAGVLTWITIIGSVVLAFATGAFFYIKYKDLDDKITNRTSVDENDETNKSIYMWAGIACMIIGAIIIILVICLFNKIRLAIAIIKCAAHFIADNPLIVLTPVVFFVVILVYYVFWCSGMLYLYSVGDVQGGGNLPFANITWTDQTRYLLAYYLFGGLWVNAFIQAMQMFVIASACSMWYFSQGPGQAAHAPIFRSVYRSFRYHFGSIAFGAFILAVVQFIRIMLSYMEYQMKKVSGEPNAAVKFLLRCLHCYLHCFERFIRFLNRNAYIQISITGKNFCFAAKDAFFLILRNPAKFAIVGGIGNIFLFFGKFFIVFGATCISYLILTRVSYFSDDIQSPIIPTVIFILISYAIGVVFMCVYSMSVDTVLQCYITDSTLNNDPKFSPPELRDFIDNVPTKK